MDLSDKDTSSFFSRTTTIAVRIAQFCMEKGYQEDLTAVAVCQLAASLAIATGVSLAKLQATVALVYDYLNERQEKASRAPSTCSKLN